MRPVSGTASSIAQASGLLPPPAVAPNGEADQSDQPDQLHHLDPVDPVDPVDPLRRGVGGSGVGGSGLCGSGLWPARMPPQGPGRLPANGGAQRANPGAEPCPTAAP